MGPGACFLDYDGDGKIDIFFPDNGPQGGMALYHNLGLTGLRTLLRKAAHRSEPPRHWLHGRRLRQRWRNGPGNPTLRGRVILLHNQKDGTFKDVTAAAGIECDGMNFESVSLHRLRSRRGSLIFWWLSTAICLIFDPRKGRRFIVVWATSSISISSGEQW